MPIKQLDLDYRSAIALSRDSAISSSTLGRRGLFLSSHQVKYLWREIRQNNSHACFHLRNNAYNQNQNKTKTLPWQIGLPKPRTVTQDLLYSLLPFGTQVHCCLLAHRLRSVRVYHRTVSRRLYSGLWQARFVQFMKGTKRITRSKVIQPMMSRSPFRC